MAPALIYLGLPLLLVVVLALLPPGPVALAGIVLGVAAVLGALAGIGDDGTGFGHLLSGVLSMAVSLGALVQLGRHQRRGAGRGQLAVIVVCLAILAAIAVVKLMQV